MSRDPLPRCGACGKVSYPEKAMAKGTARRRLARGVAGKLRVYRCPALQGWHLTHKTR